jgi:hypothetical protein
MDPNFTHADGITWLCRRTGHPVCARSPSRRLAFRHLVPLAHRDTGKNSANRRHLKIDRFPAAGVFGPSPTPYYNTSPLIGPFNQPPVVTHFHSFQNLLEY